MRPLSDSERKVSLIHEALPLYEYIAKKDRGGYRVSIRNGRDEEAIVFLIESPRLKRICRPINRRRR